MYEKNLNLNGDEINKELSTTLYSKDFKNFESMLLKLKKQMKQRNILKIIKDKSFFKKPSQIKREKLDKAKKRHKKRLKKEIENGGVV